MGKSAAKNQENARVFQVPGECSPCSVVVVVVVVVVTTAAVF